MITPSTMPISTIIINARKQKGFTQEQLAELTHLTVRTIQRIESGGSVPRAFTINALATALDIDPSILHHAGKPHSAYDRSGEKHFLQLLCLSCFAYLAIPLVHFLVPHHMLRKRQGTDPAAREFGRILIRQQVYWLVALHLVLLLTVGYNYVVFVYLRQPYTVHYLLPVFFMYGLNAVMIGRQLLRVRFVLG